MTSRMLVPVIFNHMPLESPLVSEGLVAYMAWETPSRTRVAVVLLIGSVAL